MRTPASLRDLIEPVSRKLGAELRRLTDLSLANSASGETEREYQRQEAAYRYLRGLRLSPGDLESSVDGGLGREYQRQLDAYSTLQEAMPTFEACSSPTYELSAAMGRRAVCAVRELGCTTEVGSSGWSGDPEAVYPRGVTASGVSPTLLGDADPSAVTASGLQAENRGDVYRWSSSCRECGADLSSIYLNLGAAPELVCNVKPICSCGAEMLAEMVDKFAAMEPNPTPSQRRRAFRLLPARKN